MQGMIAFPKVERIEARNFASSNVLLVYKRDKMCSIGNFANIARIASDWSGIQRQRLDAMQECRIALRCMAE